MNEEGFKAGSDVNRSGSIDFLQWAETINNSQERRARVASDEVMLWRRLLRQSLANMKISDCHRVRLGKIIDVMSEQYDAACALRELYFRSLLPVIAADTANYNDVAYKLLCEELDRLEREWMPER